MLESFFFVRKIKKILEIHKKELNSVYEAIADKRDEY